MAGDLFINLSAYADGELDPAARATVEQQIAQHPEWRGLIQTFKRLDAAAAALPVPDCAAKAKWVNPTDTVVLGAAIAAPLPDPLLRQLHAVPAVNAEQYAQVWEAIAARMHTLRQARGAIAGSSAAQPHVPQISAAKWDSVWKKIETRVSERAPVPATQPPLPRRRSSRIRWWAAGPIAAVVAVALLLKFLPQSAVLPATAPPDDGVALEVPRPTNDRYDITVEYVKGDPVVCYYLKPGERPADASGDWRWLPD